MMLKSDSSHSVGMLKIDLKAMSEEDTPYQKFLDGIKNAGTKKHYIKHLHMFLNEISEKIYQDLNSPVPTDEGESKAECFVTLAANNGKICANIIAEYIKYHTLQAEEGKLSPNTVPNYIKPIKLLLDANEVAIHWKRLYRMYPRPINSQDRAYTREEIQNMLSVAHDITDKVILTMYSSAGFRLESWDYFTWQDVVWFREEEEEVGRGKGRFKGAGLMVYRGDPESYWTFITPEACDYLWAYREKWKNDLSEYPKPTDPLLRTANRISVKRLQHSSVRGRVRRLAKDTGLRPPLPPGRRRHTVKLDHGFRKYFNTMLRRAKVNYLDKEDMMGHKVGLEKNYERYVEEDFERFAEYQKAIPFLTISDTERLRADLDESRRTTRKGQKHKSAENIRKRNEFKELFELAEKLKDAGVLEMIKKITKCRTCDEAYLGEQCPKCG